MPPKQPPPPIPHMGYWIEMTKMPKKQLETFVKALSFLDCFLMGSASKAGRDAVCRIKGEEFWQRATTVNDYFELLKILKMNKVFLSPEEVYGLPLMDQLTRHSLGLMGEEEKTAVEKEHNCEITHLQTLFSSLFKNWTFLVNELSKMNLF